MSEARNILIVVAHPEPQSFNHALARHAADRLRAAGHSVTISDLAAEGFRADVGPHDTGQRADPGLFHVQAEQAQAARAGCYAADIAREQARVAAADNVILQFPVWWGGPPALLKGWIDRVLSYGFAYVDGRRFDTGVFKGRRAMISVTTGGTPERFSDSGVYGPIEPLLMPVRRLALEYMGFEVAPLSVAYAVSRVDEETRQGYLDAMAGAALEMAARPVTRTDAWRHALDQVEDRAWASS
ncbi:NAD(P)H-dependent oxidoreductase [Pseudodonghicola flavimaris]|uniref:NAD(P)H-dependent oxidoreductase n=1 Tax=Pseudodonghicola flavimaris TaxID=3050036 RepID=A0ABT7F1Y0_9RHOB|nr:NAD(P)H-dependent oxidoreductase [Pseudodonghicola flavimaris]MDK3018622.1 NAD(P)H-dependent oxidoreductase [Pseudodonghicola flavimaris]